MLKARCPQIPPDRTNHCTCNCSRWSIKTNQHSESSSKQTMPNAGVAHFIFPINSFSCYSFLFSLLHIMDDSSRLLIPYQWIELVSLSLWTALVSKHAPHLSFLVVKSPADLFSWGCFLFWLIFRTVVFQGSSLSGGIPGAGLSFCLCSALWDSQVPNHI